MRALPLVVLVALLCVTFEAAAGSLIVSPKVAVDVLDENQVRRIFLGREARLGEFSLVVVFQRGGATRQAFDSRVLQKPGAQLTSYWSKLIFTGKARAPEEVADDDAVMARVLATPGAIGYVHDSSVDRSVKVVFEF